MHTGTQLLFDHVLVGEDLPIREFLTADYSFLNDSLGRHYGIATSASNDFQKVALPALPTYRMQLLIVRIGGRSDPGEESRLLI